ncbi:MAG: SCO family protein [Woeseiaceae bacterium]
MRVVVALGALIVAVFATPLAAQQEYDRDAALAVSQAAVGERLGDYTFRDTDGQAFRLQSLQGKPLIVSLIYTSCHHVCPLITQHVADTVEIAQEALGDDAFSVVTIGFDWQVDTPDRMRMYASAKGIDTPVWHFLSGDAASVSALSQDVGFQFYPSAKGFDHLSQTTVVDAHGRVYRQVYGQDFGPPALVEPLKELVFDTPAAAGLLEHWVDTFKLFCTVYDPNSGRYQFDYSIFMTILIGVLCLGAILTFIVLEWRHAR